MDALELFRNCVRRVEEGVWDNGLDLDKAVLNVLHEAAVTLSMDEQLRDEVVRLYEQRRAKTGTALTVSAKWDNPEEDK